MAAVGWSLQARRAELEFYTAGMPLREAMAWLSGYLSGEFLPGGQDRKRIKDYMKRSI